MRNREGREDYSKVGGELKGKAKLSNFWYYYKWHTIAAIFVVLVAAITIHECATQIHPDVSVLLATEASVSTTPLDFNAQFGELIEDVNEDGRKEVFLSEMWIPANPQDEQSTVMLQKVDLEFAGGETKLYLFDKTNYDRYITRDAFTPVGRFIDLSGVPEEKKVYNEAGEVIALNLKGSAKLKEMGFQNDEIYACFLFVRPEYEEDPEEMAQYDNAKRIVEELLK